jgi:hypothetical protein
MFAKYSRERKVLTISLIIVAVSTIITAIAYRSHKEIAFIFGLFALAFGLLEIFLGLILFLAGTRANAKIFLMVGGILLLISGVSCGGYALFG